MAIKRKSRHKNLKRSSVLRIIFCVGLLIVMFLGLSARLVILQIFQADELADKQTDFMYQNIPITASRGDIYDCNMNILAKDASCSKIYVFPGSIKDDKAVSEFLSEKLGLSYDEVYEKVSNKENKYVLLKSGVDNNFKLFNLLDNLNKAVLHRGFNRGDLRYLLLIHPHKFMESGQSG